LFILFHRRGGDSPVSTYGQILDSHLDQLHAAVWARETQIFNPTPIK